MIPAMSCIFISHAEEDQALALTLSGGLEGAGYTTWYYERDSDPGPQYPLQIVQAIRSCRIFLVVLSPVSLTSVQIDREVFSAFNAGKDFIPVLSGVSQREFEAKRPEWHHLIGGAGSIPVAAAGVPGILPRIVRGLQALGIQPIGSGVESPGAALLAAPSTPAAAPRQAALAPPPVMTSDDGAEMVL